MMRWFVDETDPPPVMKALDEARRQLAREGWCYRHVQAIMVTELPQNLVPPWARF
jgi:hypothetical protein